MVEKVVYKGVSVSRGIAIGKAFFLDMLDNKKIDVTTLSEEEIDDEIGRFYRAVCSSREDLQKIQVDLATTGSEEAAEIIDAHLQMLNDPLLTTEIEKKIRSLQQNCEVVFQSAMSEVIDRFSKAEDLFFKSRLDDIVDISSRVLRHLDAHTHSAIDHMPLNAIIFTQMLSPSDTAAIQGCISAVVTNQGGGSSHSALIARSKGIPFVSGVDFKNVDSVNRETVIVDGDQGVVIFNPDIATLNSYRRKQKSIQLREKISDFFVESEDCPKATVSVNIGCFDEMTALDFNRDQNIGLLRSECFFLNNSDKFPDEEQQFITYSKIIRQAKGNHLVFRVFDFGGDKCLSCFSDQHRLNLQTLGYRGTRFLLDHQQIFKQHLRALLRATFYGPVHILLPMIADIGELRLAKQMIHQTYQELLAQNFKIGKYPPIGCMIEVPSAAITADLLAEESDFFSLGTNDLGQLCLGIDRNDLRSSEGRFIAHPSMVRLMQSVLQAAKAKEIPVTVCGEIASNTLFIPLLLGLGFRSFSCAPRYLTLLNKVIRQSSTAKTEELAEKALKLKTGEEIFNFLLNQHPGLTKS